MRGSSVVAACRPVLLAVAVTALAGCAADDERSQPPVVPSAAETTSTTTTPPATTTTTTARPEAATTTPPEATTPPETTTTTTAPPETTTTTTAPPETTTTTTAPPEAATTTTPQTATTTVPPEATTTTVPPEAATGATGAAAPGEEQPDTAGPDQAADPSDTTGPSDDTAGEEVSAPEGDPSGAEAAAEPHREVTPYERALAAAKRLAPDFVLPNDCRPPPLNSPYSMPNAPRAYRSGVHAGVDFLCSTPSHPVVAVLGGQVVVAAGGYVDPTPAEFNELLAVATALGDTPAYTNAMLSGSYVVVDHGIIEDVGHVVSLYAHLDGVDPGIRVGKRVDAGQRLGGIGNTGTRAGASGRRYEQLHLHWNFYVDDQYLGAGLSTAETREVYAELFKHATGTATEPESSGIATAAGGSPGPAQPGTITPSGRRPLADPIPFEEARGAAERLAADIVVPSDCQPLPLAWASALPNAPRSYRSGIHQGIDLGCSTLGHPVTAALGGRVVIAVGDFEDPTPLERNQLLHTASVIGATPPYTLMMLYGNHVVIDHGMIDGVGHVVSLYGHLDELEPGLRPGLRVEAGQRLGTIGNSGTSAGASGAVHDLLHLHWELHIDGQYLGIGLSPADTRAVYTALFGNVSG